MRDINDICIVVQARLGSQRVPKKMIKPFAGTTLIDILLSKLVNLNSIDYSKVYFCAHEQELLDIASNYPVNIIKRSKASANEEKDIKILYEWSKEIPSEHIVMVSACNPVLKINTIDQFIYQYQNSNKECAISVYESKNYFCDSEGKMLNKWPKGFTSMNTKFVEPTKIAAHCMYGSRLDLIKEGNWVTNKLPYKPELIDMSEIESFDIDEPWQFKVAEQLYKNKEELWKK